MKINRWNRAVRCLITTAFISTNIVYANTVERNFWNNRSKVVQEQQSSSVQVASLPTALRTPITADTTSLMRRLTEANAPSAASRSVQAALPSSLARTHASLFESLSAQLGSLRRASIPPGKVPQRAVVLVQDIHLNLEAQTNISEALRRLGTLGGADFIALEGAWAPLHTGWFRRFRDHRAVSLVSNYLLKENRITGGGHAALMAPEKFTPVIGIDDADHYQANVAAYRRAVGSMKTDAAKIAGLRGLLAKSKTGVFNPALSAFDRSVEDYRDGKSPLTSYVKTMAQHTPPMSTVREFLAALALEEKIDFKKTEEERNAVLQQLLGRMSPVETAALTQKSLDHRAGILRYGDFYSFLQSLCEKHGVSLVQAPSLETYIRYISAAERIDVENLFDELNAMERQGYALLAKTPEERALATESRWTLLAGKLVDFSLTTEEWTEFKSLETPRAGGIDLGVYKEFYMEAEARDRAMANNVLREMNRRGADRAAIVAGGFHTPGLTKRLTQAGIAVVTFMPKVSRADIAKGGATLTIFNQEQTPLNKLFTGEKLFLTYLPLSSNTQITAQSMVAAVSRPEGTSTVMAQGVEMTLTKETDGLTVTTANNGWMNSIKARIVTWAAAMVIGFSSLTAPDVATAAPDSGPMATAPEQVHTALATASADSAAPSGVLTTWKKYNPYDPKERLFINNNGTYIVLPQQDRYGSRLVYSEDGKYLFVLSASVSEEATASRLATVVVDLERNTYFFLPVLPETELPAVSVNEGTQDNGSKQYELRDYRGEFNYRLLETPQGLVMDPIQQSIPSTYSRPVAFQPSPDRTKNVYVMAFGRSLLYIEDTTSGRTIEAPDHRETSGFIKSFNGALLVTNQHALLWDLSTKKATVVDLFTGEWVEQDIPLPKIGGVTPTIKSIAAVDDRHFQATLADGTKLLYNVIAEAWTAGTDLPLGVTKIPAGSLISPEGTWFARNEGSAVQFYNGTNGTPTTKTDLGISDALWGRTEVLTVHEQGLALLVKGITHNASGAEVNNLIVLHAKGDQVILKKLPTSNTFSQGVFLKGDSGLIMLVVNDTHNRLSWVDLTKETSGINPVRYTEVDLRAFSPQQLGDLIERGLTNVLETNRGLETANELIKSIFPDNTNSLPSVQGLLDSLDGASKTGERLDEITNPAFYEAFAANLTALLQSHILPITTIPVTAGTPDEMAAVELYARMVDALAKTSGRPLRVIVVATTLEGANALKGSKVFNDMGDNVAVVVPEKIAPDGIFMSDFAQSIRRQIADWGLEENYSSVAIVSRMIVNDDLSGRTNLAEEDYFLYKLRKEALDARDLPAIERISKDISEWIKRFIAVAQMA